MGLFTPSTAAPDILQQGQRIELFAPQEAWRVSLPASDWKLRQEKRTEDKSGFYYLFTSPGRSENFSIYLDKNDACSSGETCRELFWQNAGPGYRDARNLQRFERSAFSVIQLEIEHMFQGRKIVQMNVLAHAYKDGYWLDIHLSKVGPETPDPEPLLRILDRMQIEPR